MSARIDLVARVRRSRSASGGMAITSVEVARAVHEEAGGVVGDANFFDALRLMRQEFVGAPLRGPLLRSQDAVVARFGVR